MPPRVLEVILPTQEEIAAQIQRVRIDIAVGHNHLKNLKERFQYYHQDICNYQVQLTQLLNNEPNSELVPSIYERLFGLSHINQGLKKEYFDWATELNQNKQKLRKLLTQVQ